MKLTNLIIVLVAIGLVAIFSSYCFAFTINPDGLLNEWGVTPGAHGSSQWTPKPGIFSNEEDTPPGQDFVDPGFGGQPFDVEAIYLTADNTNLYYAIVTGFPSTGAIGYSYVTGDIAFDFGIDGSYEYGISTINRGVFSAGSLYSVPPASGWFNGAWGWKDPLSNPAYIKGGTYIPSTGNLVYVGGNYIGDHYVIEGYLSHSAFGIDWGKDVRMHWTMSCGNDYLNVDLDKSKLNIPEPATLSLLGLGLFGLISLRKKV